MFADKSSFLPLPACRPPFSTAALTLGRFFSFSSRFLRRPALNNKYERVPREYPEGAISGVQARALGLTLSHTSRSTLPAPSSASPPPPRAFFGFFHEAKRESNTLRGETRGGKSTGKGRGSQRSLYGDRRLSFSPLSLSLSLSFTLSIFLLLFF